MATKLSLKQLEERIQKAKPEEQRELLSKLPHLLNISPADVGFLKLAEDSFEFWNNPTDTIYDSL
jgi:hypothetical protein